MTAEHNIAALVVESGYSLSTVRKWWRHFAVRTRTNTDLRQAAKRLKIRRPRRTT